ncbi:MAG: PH domain-containing protein [Streptosporangiales bacterium]
MVALRKRLAPGEEVYYHLHPHWRVLVARVLILLLTAALAGFVGALAPIDILRYAVWVVLAVVVIVGVLRPVLRWWTTTYTLTDRRVLIRRGILARSGRDIPLSRVSDVAFRNTIGQRILGCGTLIIESAGEHGQVELVNVPHVELVQRDMYMLLEADAAGER